MRLPVFISGLVLSLVVVFGLQAPASAACHAFTVSVEPAEVTEGESVTVTITRDAAVAESSIDVSTVDETAVAGTDYEPLDETADFPDGGTEQTFTVATIDRDGAQGSRTFQVTLDNPQGCAVNPNYVVGEPATVAIVDADEPAETTTTAPPPAEPTPVDDVADAAPAPAPETDAQEAAPATEALAESGGSSTLLAGALVLVTALVALAFLRQRPV